MFRQELETAVGHLCWHGVISQAVPTALDCRYNLWCLGVSLQGMLNSMQLLMGVSSFAEQEWHGVIASATVSPVSVSHQLHRCLTAQSGLCLSVCLDSCLQLYGCRGSECVRIIIMMCPTLWPLLWSVIHARL